MNKKLFFYELEGRGYSFHNKNWDEVKHGFKDDMLNMAWEMWSSGQAVKAQVPEGFVLVPENNVHDHYIANHLKGTTCSVDVSELTGNDGDRIYGKLRPFDCLGSDGNTLIYDLESSNFNLVKTTGNTGGFVLVPKDQFESLNEFKNLYKRAIINAKKRKDQINWAHVAGLGVGSGRAVELCKTLNIDPSATNMYVMIEAQEQKG